MKRILAGLLAAAMIASTAVFASAATDYPLVEDFTDEYYLVDDDGYVDLTKDAKSVPYGETAYFPLLDTRGNYVDNSNQAGNASAKAKWEEGGTYVGDLSVVRKRVTSDSKLTSNVSTRLIYFLAIETKQKNATKDQDLFGRVTVKQTSPKDYKFNIENKDVNIALGYVSASDSEGEGIIPVKPASFSKRDGFEEESDFTFEFEADSNASFVVNTSGQGSIVLGMNIDYDDDIGDDYPTANLYFYNGNYAQFNRTGTLYLPAESDDYYVYAIDSKGKLSKVSAEYDEDEECYAIRTNTLGRYVLSDKKLSASSAASSSSSQQSSSSGSSGAGELIVVPPPSSSTAPASSYTPPVSSSVAPPPSSSTPPAPSSTPSSSEPEESSEEESEPEEEPEEEESEPEEIVDVNTEPDDSDGPEKSGLGTFVWVLIIVALLAVAAAAGFVLYASRGSSQKKKRRRSPPRSSRSRRRDYDEDDEDDDYDEDDYDDRDFRR